MTKSTAVVVPIKSLLAAVPMGDEEGVVPALPRSLQKIPLGSIGIQSVPLNSRILFATGAVLITG
jgi:hypothetical protein